MQPFVKVQLFWLGLSIASPAICMALRLGDVIDPMVLSNVALVCVLGCWILALATPFIWPNNASQQQRFTAFIITWAVIAITFPLAWDLTWALLHGWVNGATAEDASKWYFWAYAVADTRFLRSDPLMIWIEYWSGIFAIVEIYMLRKFLKDDVQKAYKAFVVVGFMQFYGTSVFFGVEALQGFADIRPDVFSYFKFFGLNGMWMVVPALAGYMFTQLVKNADYSAADTIAQLRGKARTSPPPAALASH